MSGRRYRDLHKATEVTVSTVSYGGGVQSTALLVLAAQGDIEKRPFIFANVGEDSENPFTLSYIFDWAAPYAADNGIGLLELQKHPTRGRHAGHVETLMGRLMHPDSRSLPIPVRMSNGAPGRRSCTADFKIRLIGKLLKQWGASVEDPADVAIGISTDEIQRAKPGIDPVDPYQFRSYPLLDLRLSRTDCHRIIADAGLPDPPKSSCFFCPFHDTEAWRALQRDQPWFFERSCALEDTLNQRRTMLGKDAVYLTRANRPLREVFQDRQLQMELSVGDCDTGSCMT